MFVCLSHLFHTAIKPEIYNIFVGKGVRKYAGAYNQLQENGKKVPDVCV